MQGLINDLLAFSRVGRIDAAGFTEVDLERRWPTGAEQPRRSAIDEAGAEIDADGRCRPSRARRRC